MMQDQSPAKDRGNFRIAGLFLSLVLLLIGLFIADVLTGPVDLPVRKLLDLLTDPAQSHSILHSILFDFRLPKACTAILAGSALAVSGLQMQTLFRNPLAGPDVLGISSGASLGVALVILGFGGLFSVGSNAALSSWLQIVAAWIGSGLVLFLVLAVSLRIRDVMTILILGILFGSAASALVSILQYFSHQSMLKAFVVWSMGSLGNLTVPQLKLLSASLLVGFVLSFASMHILNILLLGEQYAQSMGIRVRRVRIVQFLSTSILAGSVTAFCGPLAFVGIVVPHLARLVFRSADHRVLMPATFIIGAILMLVADLASQLPGSDSVLPINSITALLGVPVIIWVIVENQHLVNVA